ncbi:MAG TPA: hypothetical protein VKK79_25085, partial [Candidatus Lokiarchaeia archaeon]|nr:hypothetical protein [Candidatus Lokiarchaeia archaeon]
MTYVANNQPAVPLPYRKPAVAATVPISQNGSTEQLGYIDNGQICVHWFIHVTDIHLSANANDPKDITYGEFLNFTYNQVHPFTLVVTGDLDSGIQPTSYVDVTPQTLTELGNYFALANSSPYATDPNPYRYLEVAGNHERNNDWGSQVYLNYTLTGRRLGTVQTFFTANFSHGEVAYAMVDSAAPMEAVPVPFGSEGNLDPTDFSEYSAFLSATRTAELKFTFQHQSPLDTFGMGLDPATGYLRDEQGLDTEYGVNAVFFG